MNLVLPGKRASQWHKKHQQAPVLPFRRSSRLPSSLPLTSISLLITSPTCSPTLAPMFQGVPPDWMVLDGSIWDSGPSWSYYLTVHVTASICSSALSTRAPVLPSPCPRLWGQGERTSQTLLGWEGEVAQGQLPWPASEPGQKGLCWVQNEPDTQEKEKGNAGLGKKAAFGEKPIREGICYLWKAFTWWWEKNGKYVTQYFCNYK